jgi:hypothetical protein
MDSKTQKHLNNLRSEDRDLQNHAFSCILKENEICKGVEVIKEPCKGWLGSL